MRVDYRIIADGADVTALIGDRLRSLRLTDKAGVSSDTAELTLDDRDYRIALPETGAELQIAIGYRETGLVDMGSYLVDELTGEGPVASLTIKAKAADMTGSIRAPRTQAWEDLSFGEIVEEIAGRHGLSAAVAPRLSGHRYRYLAQTAESDLHLLTRLAQDLDATAKAASGRLVVVPRGGRETADGESLAPVALGPADLSDWSWKATSRGRYGKVTARWTDRAGTTIHRLQVGDAEPELELRHRYATEDEARRAARAALTRSVRASGRIDLRLARFNGALMAEMPIDLQGIKPELCGVWTIESVNHHLGPATLVTSLSAERDNEAEDADGADAEEEAS